MYVISQAYTITCLRVTELFICVGNYIPNASFPVKLSVTMDGVRPDSNIYITPSDLPAYRSTTGVKFVPGPVSNAAWINGSYSYILLVPANKRSNCTGTLDNCLQGGWSFYFNFTYIIINYKKSYYIPSQLY